MTPSATREYITHGATMTKPDTLLRAHQKPSTPPVEVWEIRRGKKVLGTVERIGKVVSLGSGRVDLENAKDAIFIAELEAAQVRRERLKIVPDTLKAPKSSRVVQTPQVIVTMNANGGLNIELPSGPGARRKVELRAGFEGETLRRVLQEQLEGNISIGQDGAPTKAQVYHWEHHLDGFPSPRCSFCLSEGLIRGTPKRQLRKVIISKSKDVEVRRMLPQVKPRKRGESAVISTNRLNVEDLDL
jgi:hypothetical protein